MARDKANPAWRYETAVEEWSSLRWGMFNVQALTLLLALKLTLCTSAPLLMNFDEFVKIWQIP